VPNQKPTRDRPRGEVRWFGEFGLEAAAANSSELEWAIEDFLRDYPLARGRRESRRYILNMAPLGGRMHAVRLEPSAPDGTTLEATIPIGRPAGRRALLTTIGWALERASSGTRYYTRRFTANDAAPMEIVNAADEANRLLYGSRAKDMRWALMVWPLYLVDEASHGRESRPAATNAATHLSPRDRLTTRFREHRLKSVLMAAVGLWISNLVVGEMTKSAWVLTPAASGAILVGGTLSALLVYLTGAPSLIARRNADFWEAGAVVRTIVEAAFSAVAALSWGFVLLFLLGTGVAH
jgi:hypothetical protein